MKKRKERSRILLRLIRETKPIRGWLLLSAVLCLAIIACAVLGPELLGGLIDKLYAYDKAQPIRDLLFPDLLLLGGIYLAQALTTYGNAVLLCEAVSRFFTCSLRIRISEKLRRLPVSYLDKTPVGDVIDRMQEDVSVMGTTIHMVIEAVLTGVLQMLTIAVFMLLADWRLALLILLIMPLTLVLSSAIATRAEKHWDQLFQMGGTLYAMAEESLTNFPTTKAFNLETEMEDRFGELNSKHQNEGRKGNFLSSIVQPIIVFTNAAAYILIAVVGGWLIVYRGVSVGTVVTMILFARQLGGPLERIASGVSQMQQAKAASRRVFTLLDLPEETRPTAPFPGEVKGSVRFEDVDFSYRPERPLIREMNVEIEQGQNIAIVGPTGAGKTTIVNLLMRFYDVQKGRILIDGVDVAQVAREQTRGLFGMVLQDTWLFKGTVAENVAYGKADATRDEIVRACELAYCDHFIRTLPKGYDTEISEDSANISSGQRQLLTIARALLADRALLILDEATSNVDTRTEVLIQKAMDRLMEGRTCFVIAHRLSTIVNADRILVVRDGRIVEQGTHRELLAQKGFYYEIYSSQYAV